MKRLTLFLSIVISLLVLLMPALAQNTGDTDSPTIAAIDNNTIWLHDFVGDPQQIADASANGYSNLTWSPDGANLAFVALDQNFNASLSLYNRADSTLTPVDSNIQASFAVSFNEDGSQVLFVKGSTPTSTELGIFSYDLASKATSQIATIASGDGCGGGSSFPGDWRYWEEAGGLGGFYSVLETTPFGIVYTTDCGYSTALLDLETGEETSLGAVSRVELSPDRTKLAAITYDSNGRSGEELVIVDLETREVTPVETTEVPDQITWGAGNDVFYSTRHITDTAPSYDDEELERINAILDIETQLNPWEVSIHHVDLTSMVDTELYRADAYAIGRLRAVSDSLIFSQVSNASAWLDEVASGSLDNSDPEKFMASVELVPVQLFSLPISGGEPELMGDNLHNFSVVPTVAQS